MAAVFNLQNLSFASDGSITIQYISKNFKIVFYFYIYFFMLRNWNFCNGDCSLNLVYFNQKLSYMMDISKRPRACTVKNVQHLVIKIKKNPCRFLILIHNLELIYCLIKTICWLIKYSSLGLFTLIFMNLIIRNFKKKLKSEE